MQRVEAVHLVNIFRPPRYYGWFLIALTVCLHHPSPYAFDPVSGHVSPSCRFCLLFHCSSLKLPLWPNFQEWQHHNRHRSVFWWISLKHSLLRVDLSPMKRKLATLMRHPLNDPESFHPFDHCNEIPSFDMRLRGSVDGSLSFSLCYSSLRRLYQSGVFP